MTLSVYYQTKEGRLMEAEQEAQIPEDASFVWYDYVLPDDYDKQQLISQFNFSRLTMEDVITSISRPKFKDYEHYQYLACYTIEDTYTFDSLDILMKDKLLITYHEKPLKSLGNFLELMKQRRMTAQRAALVILDQVVDQYFKPIYELEEQVIVFENRHAMDKANNFFMEDIFLIRSHLIKLKSAIIPMAELVDDLKEKNVLVNVDEDVYFLHHIEDHLIKQQNLMKSAQEMTIEIRDNYESYNSYKMNRVMQILTFLSTIFLPLTLITGIYGMNFDNMPELHWYYGYYAVISIMVLITIGSLIYFKVKKWY